jgi:hypothetical protein
MTDTDTLPTTVELVGCNDAQAARFIARLTGDASSRVIFQTFDDQKEQSAKHLAKGLAGTLAERWGELVSFADVLTVATVSIGDDGTAPFPQLPST